MRKLLKNNTETYIRIRSIGLKLSPGQEYEISKLEENGVIYDTALESYILDGKVLVGWYSGSFYSDPYEGLIWLKTLLDTNTYIIEADGTTITECTSAVVTDAASGKKTTSIFMDLLTVMKELYNDPSNPVYQAGFQKFIGTGGRELEHLGRTSNLESLHIKTGWHEKEIKIAGFKGPLNILFYYSWINSFNSATNGWDNEKVAQDMCKYNLIIFGDGIENPSHGDYANSSTVVGRIKVLKPSALIFGYVAVAQSHQDFTSKVDQWYTLGAHGVFMDEAGYDYGNVSTNGREAFNAKVQYVHSKGMVCFANCWTMDHIIGTANDASYPNTTWNSNLVESKLTYNDWYLLESFPVNTTAYSGGMEAAGDVLYRGAKALAHRATYGINLAAANIINNDNAGGQTLFDFLYTTALMYCLEAVGSSDTSYASNSAAVKFWTRPDIKSIGSLWAESPAINQMGTTSIYKRFLEFGYLELDFSPGAYSSKIALHGE